MLIEDAGQRAAADASQSRHGVGRMNGVQMRLQKLKQAVFVPEAIHHCGRQPFSLCTQGTVQCRNGAVKPLAREIDLCDAFIKEHRTAE